MLSNCVRYHLYYLYKSMKTKLSLELSSYWRKNVFLWKNDLLPKVHFMLVQWVEIFSEGKFYMKLCYPKIAEKLLGSKKGRNILWNRIGIKNKWAFKICFNPLCHVTRAPNNLFLFHAIYHLSTNTFCKKNCNKVVCYAYSPVQNST